MKRKAVTDETFAEGDKIVVVDDHHLYANRNGVIERLGNASEEVKYIHARLDNVQTVITFRTFQVQKVG